jgi:hypothetical protein
LLIFNWPLKIDEFPVVVDSFLEGSHFGLLLHQILKRSFSWGETLDLMAGSSDI